MLLALAAFLGQGISTPVAAPEPQEDKALSFNPGGPMLPATRTRNIGSSPPFRGACTTTIQQLEANPCTRLNGVETQYPSTSTAIAQVDCHGCSQVHVVKEVYYCPMEVMTAVEMAPTASTSWITVCSPSIALGPRATDSAATGDVSPLPTPSPVVTSVPAANTGDPQLELVRKAQGAQLNERDAACPTTYVVQPGKSAGSMSTQYQQWVTTMVQLNCGGCPLVLSTALAGYGPAGRFSETVTVPVGTSTIYSCQ